MPDIFLSYSRDDSLAMEVIRDNLRALGFNVWIDEDHLAVGTPEWETAIETAVKQVDALVVIMTPQSKASKWVNIELRLADLHGTPVFPVLAAGDEQSAVPARLLGMQYADVRGRSDYEAGFRQLVEALAAHTGLTVGAFSMDFSGQPRVQLNVYGHNEGNIVAVGGDVAGDLNVAGRDVVQSRSQPSRPAPPQATDETAFLRRWWRLGAGLLVALLTLAFLAFESLGLSLATLGVAAGLAAIAVGYLAQRRWLSAGVCLLPLLGWGVGWAQWLSAGEGILPYIRSYIQPFTLGFAVVTSLLAASWLVRDALRNQTV